MDTVRGVGLTLNIYFIYILIYIYILMPWLCTESTEYLSLIIDYLYLNIVGPMFASSDLKVCLVMVDPRLLVLTSNCSLELQTNVREDFATTEKAPTRAFHKLKAFTFKTLC